MVVAPGTGWPGDAARPDTPVAVSPRDVELLAAAAPDLETNDACMSVCRACPRLVTWREEVAEVKRASFLGEDYWGRPTTGFGPADAAIAVLGLAPAAHGGNRTGRVFTGDRSGDWLFAALYRAGLAVQPTSVTAGDGQRLIDARLMAAVRCAPPLNAPTPAERDTCRPWLARELSLLPALRVVVVLGGFGWQALWPVVGSLGYALPVPRPRFGHGVEVALDGLTVVGCFHPSQQNTFTGKLTAPMLDDVFLRARELAGLPPIATPSS
ncbi:MAG: uracil-DNA glycosylase [Frankiales bacterium]|nr:uracil-DNA glycosylase [Frankiales bacterium]